jgi:hypothetical protein
MTLLDMMEIICVMLSLTVREGVGVRMPDQNHQMLKNWSRQLFGFRFGVGLMQYPRNAPTMTIVVQAVVVVAAVA